jgi:predicted HicB family RNase H-like nuclease
MRNKKSKTGLTPGLPRKRVTFYVHRQLKELLTKQAKRMKISLAELVRRAIAARLEEIETIVQTEAPVR